MNYGFHTEGAAELEEAIGYYEAQKTDLGRQFLDEIARTISFIRRFPEAAPRV